MSMDDSKGLYRKMLAGVQRRLASLPQSSPLRANFPQSILDDTAQQVEQSNAADLENGLWAPALTVLGEIPKAAVAELDSDLALVLQYVKPSKARDVTQFLGTTTGNRVAEWYGGLFDLWCRASVLKVGCEVELDAQLPNGRDSDMRARINGRHFRLESTVLGESNEQRQRFRRYLEAKKVDPKAVWMRPGKFDPPDAKGPCPYYNTFRLYAKVYDKIAQNLDPDKSQCADDEPNVLLVSLSGAFVHPEKPGWGWALDELFDDQPSMCGRVIPGPHLTNISLDAWIDFTAEDLVQRGVISVEQCDARMDDYSGIISAPRRLAGILLFENCTLKMARINYNAHKECSITHSEMAELERLFNTPPGYAI